MTTVLWLLEVLVVGGVVLHVARTPEAGELKPRASRACSWLTVLFAVLATLADWKLATLAGWLTAPTYFAMQFLVAGIIANLTSWIVRKLFGHKKAPTSGA